MNGFSRLRAGIRAIVVVVPALAFAQKPATPATYRDVWHLETGKSNLKSPRALSVSGDCTFWFADADSGVFRLGCTARTAQLAGALGTKQGEYREPWLMSRAGGDSVLVYDRNLERVSVFAGDGKFASSKPMRLSAAAFAEITSLHYVHGEIRAWITHFPSAADPEALPSVVVRYHDDGVARDTLASLDGVSSVYWGSTFAASHIPVPTPRRAVVAFTRDGGFVAGYTNEPRVVVHDAAGRIVRALDLALPAAATLSKADRETYADSVHRLTDAEMEVLHYDKPQPQKQYRAQIETYVKEDAAFPEHRQLYDRLMIDAGERSLWVQLAGSGKSYTRVWEVYSFADGTLERRVSVPHKGAVVDAAVKDGVLYVIERALGGVARVAKYTQ